MTHNSRRAALLFTLAFLVVAAQASAQYPTQWSAAPTGSQVQSTHLAYDNKHDVFLQVTSGGDQTAVMGRFVSRLGESLGDSFVIGTRRNIFSGEAKVAYSLGTSDDVFMVIYWSDANGATTFAQRVRYTGTGASGGTLVGDYIPVSPFSLGPDCVSKPNDVVYNPVAQRFLVSYEEYPRREGCAYGGNGVDIMVRSFGVDGTALTDAVNITAAAGDQRTSVAAIDWERNLYMVAYVGDRPGTQGAVDLGVFVRNLGGTTGQPLSSTHLTVRTGLSTDPAITYAPEADECLVTFTAHFSSGPPNVSGVFISTTRTVDTPIGLPGHGALLWGSGVEEGQSSIEYDWSIRKLVYTARISPNRLWMKVLEPSANMFPVPHTQLRTDARGATLRAGDGALMGISYVNDDGTARLIGLQGTPGLNPGPRFLSADVRAALESPSGAQSSGSFTITGYALDTHATGGCGVDFVDVYAFPSGSASIFIGRVTSFTARPDVRTALALPAQFANCGFSVNSGRLPAGTHTLAAFPHSSVTSQFSGTQTSNISIPSQPYSYIDTPANGSTQGSAFTVSGWALDLGAGSGPGVDTIHIWAFRDGGGASPQFFLGTQTARPDVATAVGSSQFTNSGFTANITGLTSGTWDIVVYARSTVSGVFNPRVVRVVIP
jgi:hypothetical protein